MSKCFDLARLDGWKECLGVDSGWSEEGFSCWDKLKSALKDIAEMVVRPNYSNRYQMSSQ